MGIVSSNITDQWYRKGFIYDNFKYIFKNPLWQKKMPNGFPECVLFWLSICVGFGLLRLFVVPIGVSVGFVFGLLGKRYANADRWLEVKISSIFDRDYEHNTEITGGLVFSKVTAIFAVCKKI